MEDLKQVINTECVRSEYHFTFQGNWNVLKEKIEAEKLKTVLLYDGYQTDFIIINPKTYEAEWLD